MLNREIQAALIDPKIKARLTSLGSMAIGGGPGEFATFLADETEKWGQVVRTANIKAE
jgi:tripartite-type tricarboxylate transporter receptor subunit TctC